MPRVTLTRALASNPPALPPGMKKKRWFDDRLTGFLMEVRNTGAVTFYVRYTTHTGRPREVHLGRLGDVTLDQARKRAQQMRAAAALGGDPAGERDKLKAIPTFSEFVENRYLPYAKGRLRSYRDQEGYYRLRLKALWGKRRLDEIRPHHVADMQDKLRHDGLSNASVNRYTALAKRIFNVAIDWEVYEGRNPAQRAEMRREQRRNRFLSDQELVALFRALELEPNRTAACAIALLAATGARRGEALGAKWEDIDMERRDWEVPLSKSGKERHILLSDEALRILHAVPRVRGSPWVFPGPDPVKPIADLKKAWMRVKKRAGIEGDFCLHQLRHTYASRLVQQGRSLYEVGHLLGHAGTAMTMRYAHLDNGRLIEAVNLALPEVA